MENRQHFFPLKMGMIYLWLIKTTCFTFFTTNKASNNKNNWECEFENVSFTEKMLMRTHVIDFTKRYKQWKMKKMLQLIQTINKEKYKIYMFRPVFHLLYILNKKSCFPKIRVKDNFQSQIFFWKGGIRKELVSGRIDESLPQIFA